MRGKSKDDLIKQLDELKTELAQLKVHKVTGGTASKLSKMSVDLGVEGLVVVLIYYSVLNNALCVCCDMQPTFILPYLLSLFCHYTVRLFVSLLQG